MEPCPAGVAFERYEGFRICFSLQTAENLSEKIFFLPPEYRTWPTPFAHFAMAAWFCFPAVGGGMNARQANETIPCSRAARKGCFPT